MARRRFVDRQRAVSVRRRSLPHHRRLRFEPLEDRRVLAVMTVTDLQDDTLANLAGDGQLSLREAIEAINTGAAVDGIGPTSGTFGVDDQIVFDASLFTGGEQTILLVAGELGLASAVTITGPGQDVLTIDAQQQSRIFDITATAGDFLLDGLTLTGGRTTANGQAGNGGAIRSRTTGNLTLDQSTVSGNSTAGMNAQGGGIRAIGTVTLTQSTVSGNSTTEMNAYGGGIWASGAVTLTQSTVSGNSTTGSSARGGGIHAGGAVTLTQSTVSGNSTVGDFARGGGIHTGGAVTLTQSTVSGNSTTGSSARGGGIRAFSVTLTQSTVSGNSTVGNSASGGGIFVYDSLTLIQSTVSGNSTAGSGSYGGGIWAGSTATLTQSTITDNHVMHANSSGGGVFQYDPINEHPISISGSILAGNSAGGGGADHIKGFGTDGPLTVNYSLIGTGITPDSGGNNVVTDDPQLGPLADNGGPTMTHALLPGGPAIDAGDPGFDPDAFDPPLHYDQRGEPFSRVVGGRVDIGAFEVQSAGPALPGDYNLDGIVDAADYTVWRNTLGDTGVTAYSGADGDGDGDITAGDYSVWKQHYGDTLPPGAGVAGLAVAVDSATGIAAIDVEPVMMNVADEVATPVQSLDLPSLVTSTRLTTATRDAFATPARSAISAQAVDLLLATTTRGWSANASDEDVALPASQDDDRADGDFSLVATDAALVGLNADF